MVPPLDRAPNRETALCRSAWARNPVVVTAFATTRPKTGRFRLRAIVRQGLISNILSIS